MMSGILAIQKHKMKKLILFLLIGALSATAHADKKSEKQIVYERVKNYADLVSCSHSFGDDNDAGQKTTLSDIFLTEKDKYSTSYYVFWGGDMGCNGASSSASTYITKIYKRSHHDKFYIIDDFAFGDDVDINYRFIESIKQISQNKFVIVSWDFADEKFGGVDGGSNFPANKFEYTIERPSSNHSWELKNKKLIEQHTSR